MNDADAFAALYDAHVDDVRRTAIGILGDAGMAEDVAHEVFLDVWRRPGQYDPARGEMAGFLRVKARSRALDAWRRVASSARVRDRWADEVSVRDTVHVDDHASAPSVRAAVRRLPHSQREAIALAYWGGLTCSEIAAHCDVPLGTVKSRMRLGLARLARDVAAMPPPAPAVG